MCCAKHFRKSTIQVAIEVSHPSPSISRKVRSIPAICFCVCICILDVRAKLAVRTIWCTRTEVIDYSVAWYLMIAWIFLASTLLWISVRLSRNCGLWWNIHRLWGTRFWIWYISRIRCTQLDIFLPFTRTAVVHDMSLPICYPVLYTFLRKFFDLFILRQNILKFTN